MSTFIKFLFIFYFFFISFSYSETLKTSDLFVTATRSNQESDNLLSDISIINYDEINKSGSTSIVDLLQRQPGIEISNSGGLGKQSSVYMRGANANQLIVLVDGVRMNSITTGLTAFENLPLSQIEKIEILRGPTASLYGSDGIGGVIQIFTKKNKSGFNPYANFGYSRYATKTNTIGFTAGAEKLRYGFHLNSIDSNGFSSLQTNEAIIKDDDGFNSLNINGNIEYDFDKDNSVKLSLLSNQGHNEYDNRYRSFYGNTVPNVKNKMLNQNINLLFKNKFLHNWDSQLLLSSSFDKYTDQQIINANYDGLERSNLYYQTIQNEFNWTNNIQSSIGSFTFAIDRLEQKLSSNNAYDENRRNNTGYVFNYIKDFGPHIIHGSYRVDLNTHSGTNNTKSIGYGFKFNHYWKASLQYGEAFKNPTFNDLYAAYDQYYTPNPNLQSETSKNIEANINFVDESNNLKVTVFENRINDLITLYTCGWNTCIENSSSAKITGLTITGNKYIGHTQLYSSLTTQSADTENDGIHSKLARRASFFGTFGITHYFDDWTVGTELTGSGSKYNDRENNAPIPGYIISNFFINKLLGNNWQMNFRVNNLLDKEYYFAYEGNPTIGASNAYRYNNPGRSAFINLIYETK